MIIKIPKETSPKKIRSLLKKRTANSTKKNIDSFFGQLPKIEDGVMFQKKVRNEWQSVACCFKAD